MKIGVMGAGAVGCFYGGTLALAGHDVVFIGRQTHVDAIIRNGLNIELQTVHKHVFVAASTDASALADVDVVLCCVKSGDSADAAAQMAPWLAARTTVFSLQNGVDNAERLSAVLGRPVIPAVVYVATEMVGPGHLRHHGRGELVIAPSPASDTLKVACDAAGVPVTISDNVSGALWSKLVVNCVYNGLSAITMQAYEKIIQGENVVPMLHDIVNECVAVANAAGIQLIGDQWANSEAIARSMPNQMSSTAQDLARRRRSEIDYINGYLVKRGESLGVPTPVNRAIHAIVRLLENQ